MFFSTDSNSIDPEDIGVIIVSNLPSMKVAYNYMGINGIKEFEMNGMWRLENQKGLFLQDVNGDFEIFGRFIKLFFKQNKDLKFQTDSVNSDSIYPKPNSFEEEINRYFSINLRSRTMDEIDPDNLLHPIRVERDPISIEFETQIKEFDWKGEKSSAWKFIDLIPYKKTVLSDSVVDVTIECYDYFEVTPGEKSDLVNLVKHIDKTGSTSFTLKINLNVNIADPLFSQESASLLFTNMVADFSKNYGKLPFDMCHETLSLKILSLFAIHRSHNLKTVISDDLDILCMTYRTGKLTHIELEDYQGVVSHAYIDRDFCHKLTQMTCLKTQFNNYFNGRKGFLNENGDLVSIHLEENFQLFRFVNRAKALFHWEDVIQIWTLYVIPYQVFFRENSSSIFNPYYLELCGLA